MLRIQLVFVAVALFICSGLGQSNEDEDVNYGAAIIMNRASGISVRGNGIPMTDLTTFNVSEKVMLTSFDIAAMYLYHADDEDGWKETTPTVKRNLEVKIQKMKSLDAQDEEKETVYEKDEFDSLKSENGTKVELETPLTLDPDFFYAIKVGYFGVDSLYYKEDLQIGEIVSGPTPNGESIKVKFYQKNTEEMLQDYIRPFVDFKQWDFDLSKGLVESLCLKYI